MANKRIKYSEAQQVSLISQVESVCPLCSEPLFYKKSRSKTQKNYELAHIYPLNPKPEEVVLLKDEERLSDDVNDERNIIPLCKLCHGKFDKPRTVKEYRQLVAIKKKLNSQTVQQQIWKEYSLEAQITEVIKALYANTDIDISTEIEYDPKAVDEKIDNTMTRLTYRKIKNNVSDYFMFVRQQFSVMDQEDADLSDRISLQVKTYYLKQKSQGLSQQQIFENIVSWLDAKTKPKTSESTEILASFFVQNCEVF